MGHYLDLLDAAKPADRWPLARGWMYDEAEPFFAEMRAERPVLELPEVTMVFRFADCTMVLRRHDDFGVDLYVPKQGTYLMAQDFTAQHWRDKAVMSAILDFEEVPAMRKFVGDRTNQILDAANGRIDAPKQLTRMVPVGLVQDVFGFVDSDPAKLIDWSYWNQQDAFHNQPFDIQVPDHQYIVDQRNRANTEMAIYLGKLVFKRRFWPFPLGRTDSVSRVCRLQASGAIKMDIPRLAQNVGGLLIGAIETTSHTVNHALAELGKRPDMLAAAKAAAQSDDPAAFDGYVFEALRFRPAFTYYFRVCHKDTLLAADTPQAATVAKGTTVIAVTHSAIHDQSGFPDPEKFNSTRALADSFIFGQGLHECLGIQIARAMVPEVVRQCLRRKDFAVDGPITYERSVPEHQWLTWTV